MYAAKSIYRYMYIGRFGRKSRKLIKSANPDQSNQESHALAAHKIW